MAVNVLLIVIADGNQQRNHRAADNHVRSRHKHPRGLSQISAGFSGRSSSLKGEDFFLNAWEMKPEAFKDFPHLSPSPPFMKPLALICVRAREREKVIM